MTPILPTKKKRVRTPAQKQRRIEWDANQTPEQLELRREYMRDYNRTRPPEKRHKPNPEQIKTYRARNIEYMRKSILNLAPEEKERKREHFRNLKLKRQYGMTLEQWNQMFDTQGKCCAICKSPEPKGKGQWHTDHCHGGLGVRGILCHYCNLLLGHSKDSLDTLQAAIGYLSAHAASYMEA